MVTRSALRLLARGSLLAVLGLLAGCGGSDSLPAAGVGADPPPGGVSVVTVEGATLDDGTWFTRRADVTARGEAPPGTMVEALREADGAVTASARAGGDGAYALLLSVPDPLTIFLLRATRPGAPPGPATRLRILRRTTPPDPFTVDPLPDTTAALGIAVQGTAERDVVVIVRVEGGAAPAQARKPAGESRFRVEVPLARDQAQRLTVTAEDLAGNRTAPIVRTIVQDSTAPPPPAEIHVLDANGNVVVPPAPISVTRTTLAGRADEAARVEAAGPGGGAMSAAVGAGGRFAFTVDLAEGDNPFDLVAVDAAGNRSAPASVVVVRDTSPPPPPSGLTVAGLPVETSPLVVVAGPGLEIRGFAEPGSMVEAAGDGLFGATQSPTAPDGAFDLLVPVSAAFGQARLDVQAIDAAGNRSVAASFTVSWEQASGGGERGAR